MKMKPLRAVADRQNVAYLLGCHATDVAQVDDSSLSGGQGRDLFDHRVEQLAVTNVVLGGAIRRPLMQAPELTQRHLLAPSWASDRIRIIGTARSRSRRECLLDVRQSESRREPVTLESMHAVATVTVIRSPVQLGVRSEREIRK